jgi:cation diffusion facilitator family transporter
MTNKFQEQIIEQQMDNGEFGNSIGSNPNSGFAKAVKIALVINFLMFVIEIGYGFYANSLSLILDATDFLGDSLNYAIAIFVLSKPKKWQSISALIKASFMLAFGIYVFASGVHRIFTNIVPKGDIMMIMSFFAFIANVAVSIYLFSFRKGSSNQQSVWLCSRNDAINNLLTIGAGFLTLFWQSKFPDLIIAAIMSVLAISASWQIFATVKQELKEQPISNINP